MTWLDPVSGALLAAVLIPPLLLLYFLKLRRRPRAVASTLLWERSVEDIRANAPFQRLRFSVLLLLQLLALLLLALSVMQPQFQSASRRGGRTVLLIDNSASMTATDGEDGVTRLDEAKKLVRKRIEALYGGGLFGGAQGETMIVAFSDRAEVITRFSSAKAELLAAIDRIVPTHGETRIAEALEFARAYTTNTVDAAGEARPVGELPTLELFSDGRIEDLAEQVLKGETLVFHRVGGAEADNVAVGAIAVDRPYDRPTAVQPFVSLLNFNTVEVRCDVELAVNGRALRVQEVTLPAAEDDAESGERRPGGTNVVFTPFEQPRDAVIEVTVLRVDDLAADNAARVVVPPPKQLSVALVGSKLLLETVLEGLSLRKLELVTPAQFESLASGASGGASGGGGSGLDRYDVIVLNGWVPAAGGMPPARYLSLGPTPPVEGLAEFGSEETQIVLNVRSEHPCLRFVNLDQLYIEGARLIQPADDVEVLVTGSQGPLMLAVSRGPLQLVHVPFDPVDSNWPFHRSFVTFIYNAIDYLGHSGERLTSEGFAPGEAITSRLPSGATEIELRVPGEAEPIGLEYASPSLVSWGPARLAGLYRLSWNQPGEDDRREQPIAVNLASQTEGRLDTPEKLVVGRETVAPSDRAAGTYRPLWPWAIGFCLLVLMIEWWVYQRRAA